MSHREGETDDSHQNKKKCAVCAKGFSFRKKVLCCKCENAYCTNHCCKIIATVEGEKILCDACYHEYRRIKIQEKFSQEIEGLNLELGRVRQACNRVERDFFDKTTEIGKFESENEKNMGVVKKALKKLQKEQKEVNAKLEAVKSSESLIEEEFEKSQSELKQANAEFIKSDTRLEEVKNEYVQVVNVRSNLMGQLMDLRAKVEHCMDYEKVTADLCVRCKETLRKCYQERVNREQGDESSMSLYTSQSILDSVREMKDSLNVVIVEPEKQPNCLVI